MRSRILAAVAAVWTVAYGYFYIELIRDQGNSPAWWYVALLAIAAIPLILVAADLPSGPGLAISSVLLAVATVLALASIGMLLLPAFLAAVVAMIRPKPARWAG